MKLLLVALFAAAASARLSLIPDEEDRGPVDVVKNGVPEGEPLEIGHIVNVKLKENVNEEIVSAANVPFPYTAEGLALAAIETESPAVPDLLVPEGVPDAVILLPPATPEVIPEPEVNPDVLAPEVVTPVVLLPPPAPKISPDPIILPSEVVQGSPNEEVLPEPAAQGPNGEVFNDGLVSLTVNSPEDPGVLATLQSWLNMAMNYFNTEGEATSHQVI